MGFAHTYAISIYQNYGGTGSFDKFIDALERLPKDVKVIGITDYISSMDMKK